MKAIINGSISDRLDCSDGIAFTFYKMIDGKKEIGKIKDFIITDDIEKSLDLCKKDFQKTKNKTSNNSSLYILENLEEDLNIIYEKMNATSQLLNDFEALSYNFLDENAPEEYQFIERMRFSLFYMCIIELAKLFTDSKSQSFNIFSFLRKADEFIRNNVSVNDAKISLVSILQKRIDEGEVKYLIENIHYTRDKIFAHTDRDAFKDRVGIELHNTQIEKLLNIGFEVISELATTLFNRKLDRNNPDSGAKNVFSIIDKEMKG